MSAFTEANRKAFDDLSATYNTKPWQHDLSNTVAEALQARKAWLGAEWVREGEWPGRRDVRLLDYACGTGSITKALGPYVHTIRGIDISEGMVAKYNEAASSSGLTEEQAHAVVGDFLAQNVDAKFKRSEWYEFDVAVIGLGFHHFEFPEQAINRLAERLKARTGVLVIVDFLPFENPHKEGVGHGAEHTIKHSGFTGEQMRDMYQAAGFEDFDITSLKQPVKMELKSGETHRRVFIAKGRKSATAMQKLGDWIGGMQEWAAGGLRTDRVDSQHYDPFLANDSAKSEGVWNIGKQKDQTYKSGSEQMAPTKSWNAGLPRHDDN